MYFFAKMTFENRNDSIPIRVMLRIATDFFMLFLVKFIFCKISIYTITEIVFFVKNTKRRAHQNENGAPAVIIFLIGTIGKPSISRATSRRNGADRGRD